MDENRLDGNAVGGLLREVFLFEMTIAETACTNCGMIGRVGAQMAYVSEIGTIVRCAACDNALIRIAREDGGRGRYWLDLRGVKYLQIEEAR
jgi:hypothetical protein